MKIKLVVLFVIIPFFITSCEYKPIKQYQETTNKNERKHIIKELYGLWFPKSYSGSKGQSLTTRDVNDLMKLPIYI